MPKKSKGKKSKDDDWPDEEPNLDDKMKSLTVDDEDPKVCSRWFARHWCKMSKYVVMEHISMVIDDQLSLFCELYFSCNM